MSINSKFRNLKYCGPWRFTLSATQRTIYQDEDQFERTVGHFLCSQERDFSSQKKIRNRAHLRYTLLFEHNIPSRRNFDINQKFRLSGVSNAYNQVVLVSKPNNWCSSTLLGDDRIEKMRHLCHMKIKHNVLPSFRVDQIWMYVMSKMVLNVNLDFVVDGHVRQTCTTPISCIVHYSPH